MGRSRRPRCQVAENFASSNWHLPYSGRPAREPTLCVGILVASFGEAATGRKNWQTQNLSWPRDIGRSLGYDQRRRCILYQKSKHRRFLLLLQTTTVRRY